MDKITYGKLGEEKAQQFLKQQGYKILAVNYQLRCGEIDIIAQKGKVIIFAEVKTRISDLYGVPAAAVNLKKQQKIIKVARQYLLRHNKEDGPCRFDVIEVKSIILKMRFGLRGVKNENNNRYYRC